MTTKLLTRAQLRKLGDAAQAAWDGRSPESTRVEFSSRGEAYVVSHVEAELCLRVKTIDGRPVASLYV